MLWACKQLGAPLRYLRIKQGESLLQSKTVYDWILPAILAAGMVLLNILFEPRAATFSEFGIIGGFKKLLEILVPFYIAALAAVATFDRPGLDVTMKGTPATLKMLREHGEYVEHILTRRQFICYLFGYLAFLSLCLFVAILLLTLFWAKVGLIFVGLFGVYVSYFKAVALFVFLLPIWQLIVTTLLGIYFLSDRLQSMDDPGR